MSSVEPAESATRVQRWLEHGARLCLADGNALNPVNVVWALIAEAVDTFEKMPDQEKRWLTSGTRSGGWNMIGMTRIEAVAVERDRMMGAMEVGDRAMGYKPQADTLDRATEVLDWFRYANRAKEAERLRKAAYLLAKKGDVATLAKVYAPGRKSPGRQLAYEVKTRLCGFILAGLKTDHGLAVGPGGAINHV